MISMDEFRDFCKHYDIAEKNIKYKSNRLYNTMPQEEAELIMIILRKVHFSS